MSSRMRKQSQAPVWTLLAIVVLINGLCSHPPVQAATAGQSWAVVIGIEAYDHEHDLRYAVDDAEAMRTRLESLGFKVLSLTDHEATRTQILDLLEVDLRKLVRQKEDQVVIYFSGHGVTYPEEGASRIGYIVPVDAQRSRIYDEGIGMERLARYAKSLPAKQVLFLLDACYSGMAGTQEKTLPPLSEQRLKRLLREPGKYIMVAGSGNQESLEGSDWEHGLFTHYLLKGLGSDRLADLNGDQLITVGELFEYVKPRVEDEAVIQGKSQVPELWKLTGDQGQLAFVYGEASSIPATVTPKPTAPEPPPVVASAPTYQAPKTLAKEITGKDGAPMVLVPKGEFTMGARDDDLNAQEDERPAHAVSLDAFYIDKFEVTTKKYRDFLNDTGRKHPGPWSATIPLSQGQKPVVGVSWHDAKAYCEHYEKRLPTEAEWEKAARGTDERLYPWGNETPTSQHANFNKSHFDNNGALTFDNYGVLTKGGKLEAGVSPYGAYDMAGNVMEWVSDWYARDYYQNGPKRNPQGPQEGNSKVIRGGSWVSDAWFLRSSVRGLRKPSLGDYFIGFRCAQDAL